MVPKWICNQGVGSSNPSAGTNKINDLTQRSQWQSSQKSRLGRPWEERRKSSRCRWLSPALRCSLPRRASALPQRSQSLPRSRRALACHRAVLACALGEQAGTSSPASDPLYAVSNTERHGWRHLMPHWASGSPEAPDPFPPIGSIAKQEHRTNTQIRYKPRTLLIPFPPRRESTGGGLPEGARIEGGFPNMINVIR